MFHHILVPLDGSSLAECVIPHCEVLAKTYDARITLLHVLERRSPDHQQPVDTVDWYLRKAEAEVYLDDVVAYLDDAGVPADRCLLEGHVGERIVDYIRTGDVDLVLFSSHGQSGLTGWTIGSVAHKVVARAGTSLMIVPAYKATAPQARYRRILVPLDGSQRAEHVLPVATMLARRHDAQLLLVHVVAKPEMPRRVPPTGEDLELAERLLQRNVDEAHRYLEQLQRQISPAAEARVLVSDDVSATLHDLLEDEDVDLTLLSAHGYSAGTKWPHGSVTTSLIGYCTTPMLVMQDLAPADLEPSQAEVAARQRKGH